MTPAINVDPARMGVGNRELLTFDTQLTSAQVKALAATNIDLAPAPGAGKALVPVAVLYFLDRNAAYDDAAADGDLILAYKTTQTALITSQADAFIDAAADAAKFETLPDADLALEEDTALVLDNDGAEFTGDAGNLNTLSVRVYYFVVPFTPFG